MSSDAVVGGAGARDSKERLELESDAEERLELDRAAEVRLELERAAEDVGSWSHQLMVELGCERRENVLNMDTHKHTGTEVIEIVRLCVLHY